MLTRRCRHHLLHDMRLPVLTFCLELFCKFGSSRRLKSPDFVWPSDTAKPSAIKPRRSSSRTAAARGGGSRIEEGAPVEITWPNLLFPQRGEEGAYEPVKTLGLAAEENAARVTRGRKAILREDRIGRPK